MLAQVARVIEVAVAISGRAASARISSVISSTVRSTTS
jgi:hypothetical protein